MSLIATLTLFAGNLYADTPVEDDMAWGLYCPGDKYVSCTANLNDLSQFGWAYVHDYSGTHYLYNPTVSHHLSGCNTGYITRTWSAYDPYSGTNHSCTQTIHLTGGQYGSFDYHDIHWPQKDIELTGCNPNVNPYSGDTLLAPPTWNYVACSNVGVSYSDKVFYVNADCRKIVRTWKVVDWCQSAPYTGAGEWTYEQKIKIINSERPQFTCPDDVTVSSFNCVNAYVVIPALEVDLSSCGGYYSVVNNSTYADSQGADLSGTYPIGKHKVKLTVNYGCGHKRSCHVEIVVDNKKAPTPYCFHTLTTALMPVDTDADGRVDDGMVEIWAEDLDKGSFAHCGNGPVEFSFSADLDDKSRMFSCAHVGSNELDMWVTDKRGNQAYCSVNLVVQNNNANIPDCGPRNYNNHPMTPLAMSGSVMQLDNQPVADATIELVDMSRWMPRYRVDSTYELTIDSFVNSQGYVAYVHNAELVIDSVLVRPTDHPSHMLYSDANGMYAADSVLAHNTSYMIRGLDAASSAALTLDDAHALLAHVIGLQPFKTPYAYIAADIDQDQDVDITDFRLLYQFVKNGQAAGAAGEHVMVDASYEWATPAGALVDCPDEVRFETSGVDVEGVNWYVVQIGKLPRVIANHVSLSQRLPQTGLPESEILAIRSELIDAAPVVTYPNPFADYVNIDITASDESQAIVRFYTVEGRLLMQQAQRVAAGSSSIQVAIDEGYKGIVLYEVQLGDAVHSGRLLKL